MPYKRIGTTVYKKLPNGKLKSVGVSDSVDLAKAHLRALYAAETNESMGNIEKTITEILKNKTVTESSSGNINPKVQSFLDECDRIIDILMDDDLFKQEQSKHSISLTEGLSPEVSKKAVAIFKSMIADKRDSLFKRYGADAEKVAYGHAIAKAKQINEKQTMQQTDKLREMVRAALSTPMDEINSTTYINERESVTEDDWMQPDDESDMAKSQLHNLIKDAQRLESMIVDGEQLDAWVQAKLTKAQDYINSVHEYLCGEKSTKKHVDIELTERIFNRIKNRM